MNDPRIALQTRYFTLLNSALSVPVYDVMAVPSDPPYPHVIIGNYTEVDDSDKTSFGSEVTVTITVIDRAVSAGSRAQIYALCDTIKNTIRTRPSAFTGITGWNVYTATLDQQVDIPKALEDGYIYFGQSIRFRHNTEQL